MHTSNHASDGILQRSRIQDNDQGSPLLGPHFIVDCPPIALLRILRGWMSHRCPSNLRPRCLICLPPGNPGPETPKWFGKNLARNLQRFQTPLWGLVHTGPASTSAWQATRITAAVGTLGLSSAIKSTNQHHCPPTPEFFQTRCTSPEGSVP